VYGEQFLYTIELDGQRDKLYATPKLHQQLQEAQVGPGSILTVTKVEGEGNRKSWAVAAEEEESTEGKPNGREGEKAPASPPASGNGQPSLDRPVFASLELLMDRCLRASWDAWCALEEGPAFSSEDVRNVGITLFLECARKGIVPQVAEESVPF